MFYIYQQCVLHFSNLISNFQPDNDAFSAFYIPHYFCSGDLSIRILKLKVRGPFIQTLCIEKDSYMDTI